MTANEITETLKGLIANRSKMSEADQAKVGDIMAEFGTTCVHCCNDEQVAEMGAALKARLKHLAAVSG